MAGSRMTVQRAAIAARMNASFRKDDPTLAHLTTAEAGPQDLRPSPVAAETVFTPAREHRIDDGSERQRVLDDLADHRRKLPRQRAGV